MYCLSLGKGLFPSIRTWKSFTTKLFRKLRPRKTIKIAKTHRPKTTRAPPPPPAMYYPPLPYKKRQIRHRAKLFGLSKALHRPKRQLHFKKQSLQAPPPVFVDELFWTHMEDPGGGLAGCPVPAKGKAEPTTSSAVPETGDEMWESVGLGSPQMRGIDARAEEFIARFRAELEFQDLIAHHL